MSEGKAIRAALAELEGQAESLMLVLDGTYGMASEEGPGGDRPQQVTPVEQTVEEIFGRLTRTTAVLLEVRERLQALLRRL